MTTMFRIRVDKTGSFTEHYLEDWLKLRAIRFLVVNHRLPIENEHYHIWMESKFKPVTIRMEFPKKFNVSGNKDFCIQDCDPIRKDEFLQYMFNRKKLNVSTFVAEQGVPDWEAYKLKADEATVEYLEAKEKSKFSKDDCINLITTKYSEELKNWSADQLLSIIISESKSRKSIFSINAIRDIILYIGVLTNLGELSSDRTTYRYAVLRAFEGHRF